MLRETPSFVRPPRKHCPNRAVWPRRVVLSALVALTFWSFGAAALNAQSEGSQSAIPPENVWVLGLDEALAIARTNNPAYRQATDATAAATWAAREAYGTFLPWVTASSALRYSGAGQQLIGNFTGDDLGAASTDYYLSDYSLNVRYSISGRQIYGIASSRAERDAAEARAGAAAYELASNVTVQYLTALRAADATAVAARQLERANQGAELARARAAAGAAPQTDVVQAEIEQGRAEVALVRAENLQAAEVAGLLEVLGVSDTRTIRLENDFDVFEPGEATIAAADRGVPSHPRIQALRQTERARQAGVRQAQSAYLPTVTLNASWSGFTREIGNTDFLLNQARSSAAGSRASCQRDNAISAGLSTPLDGFPRDCDAFLLTPEDEASILAGNEVFPFAFEKQPFSLSLGVSVPLFQGFTRQRQVEEAQVQARAAAHQRRAEELRVSTEITTARGSLRTAYDVVLIEERNRNLAGEQLALAQERYLIGAAPFLELLDAQSSAATAELDYLNAVYDFHTALADLERLSGVALRPR